MSGNIVSIESSIQFFNVFQSISTFSIVFLLLTLRSPCCAVKIGFSPRLRKNENLNEVILSFQKTASLTKVLKLHKYETQKEQIKTLTLTLTI